MKRIIFLLVGLLACLSPAPAQSTAVLGDATGIEGTISVGPVQGGPTKLGSPDSRPLANAIFEVKQGDRVLTTFQTNDQGHFQTALEPGHYTISRKDWKAAVGFYGPFEAVVSRGKITSVQWKCDTGLR